MFCVCEHFNSQAYHLPVVMPRGLDIADLMEKMAVDKKNKGGKKAIVLLRDIGTLVERKSILVDDTPIEKILSLALELLPVETQIKATLRVPGSKSISNRALLLAAMGAGTCTISGLLHSDDTQVMIEALQQLGVKQLKWGKGASTLTITGSQVCSLSLSHTLFWVNATTINCRVHSPLQKRSSILATPGLQPASWLLCALWLRGHSTQ